MSAKNLDQENRWRTKTVAFRMSPEEAKQLDREYKLSGMDSKQEYLISCLHRKEVVIHGSSRVYKALREEMRAMCQQLERLSKCSEMTKEMHETIRMIGFMMDGMKEDDNEA